MRVEPTAEHELPRHRLFGVTLASSFDFRTPLVATDLPPDLTFTCSRAAPRGMDEPEGIPAFTSRHRLPSGAPLLAVYREGDHDLVRYTEVADFRVADDHIHCHLIDPAYDFMVEIHLLGLVISYWFERRGIPMLHASAVAVDGLAAVFVATNKGGKSSLAAELVRAGHPLLSDDIVGLEMTDRGPEARPGFPSMRLWPDQAAHFHGDWKDLDLAHPREEKRRVSIGEGGFGTFMDVPAPLAMLYLPDRREADDDGSGLGVEMTTVNPGEAVIELVRGSFLPRLVQECGFARERMALFGRVASAVPMKRLGYPSGNEHLRRVADAIVADLREAAAGAERTRP